MRSAALAACFLLAGCGSATFTLPPPGVPAAGRYEWRPLEEIQQPRTDFDSAAAIAPRVFRFGQFYYNLYSAHNGEHWITGLTASLDGLDWNLGRKALAPDSRIWEGERMAAFGAVLVMDELIGYWYTAGEPARIGHARSHDGRAWRREQEPVIEPGPKDSWDSHSVAYPAVIGGDGLHFMYYAGTDASGRARLGLARSSDGIKWIRHRGNPLLDLDRREGVAVWLAHGHYWMLRPGSGGSLRLSRSADGVRWQLDDVTFPGEWPCVVLAGSRANVWYSLDGAFRAGRLEWIAE